MAHDISSSGREEYRPYSKEHVAAALLELRLAMVRHLGLPDDYAYLVPSPAPGLAKILDLPDPEVQRRTRAMRRIGWGEEP
jgi:hypothetical protein